jgi:hypothetical protein
LAAGAVFAAMIASGSEARAALTGITVSGGFKPGTGDPPYDYIFEIYLAPGATIYKNELIEFGTATAASVKKGDTDYLLGITPASLHAEDPLKKWELDDITEVYKKSPFGSDVTWEYSVKTHTNTTGNPEHIGELSIQTVIDFNNQNPFPVKAGTPLTYMYELGTQGSGPQTLYLQNLAVPEPSSAAIVLITGGPAAIAAIVRRRRHRPGGTA